MTAALSLADVLVVASVGLVCWLLYVREGKRPTAHGIVTPTGKVKPAPRLPDPDPLYDFDLVSDLLFVAASLFSHYPGDSPAQELCLCQQNPSVAVLPGPYTLFLASCRDELDDAPYYRLCLISQCTSTTG